MPFVDPVTREKVKSNPDIFGEGIFLPDMLMEKWWGGSQDFDYVHEKYWPSLIELCESRTKEWMRNWRDLGGKVGCKEWDYKQGNVPLAKHEETDEKEETAVSIDASAEVTEVLKKEVKLVPNTTADAVESADHAIHEGESVVGAITGGAEGNSDAASGHGGETGDGGSLCS